MEYYFWKCPCGESNLFPGNDVCGACGKPIPDAERKRVAALQSAESKTTLILDEPADISADVQKPQGKQEEYIRIKPKKKEHWYDEAEEERRAKEAAAKAEAERIAKEAAAKAEAERRAREAAAKAEAERRAKEAAAKAEAERRAKEAAAKAEAERLAKEAAAKAEAERLAKEAAAKAEAERRAAQRAFEEKLAAAKRERDAAKERKQENLRNSMDRILRICRTTGTAVLVISLMTAFGLLGYRFGMGEGDMLTVRAEFLAEHVQTNLTRFGETLEAQNPEERLAQLGQRGKALSRFAVRKLRRTFSDAAELDPFARLTDASENEKNS